MGKQISAKFASTCPDCGASWKTGESIFYDKFVTNSKGKSFACTDAECAKEHKVVVSGTFTPGRPSSTTTSGYSYQDKFMTANTELNAVIPNVAIGSQLVDAGEIVKATISLAHSIAEEMYPGIPANSHTFGQIRSKLVDQILAVRRG